ncbi:MAG: hypothetical protein IT269_14400 [Saprospiraceae bacterium]|nr:hypothetical protein [Saprospiraceae bacterium]
MVNNLKKLQADREAMLPPELENRISRHLGAMAGFGKVVELFVPNALQTVVRLIGGEDLPCFKRSQYRDELRHEPEWRTPPKPGNPGVPKSE